MSDHHIRPTYYLRPTYLAQILAKIKGLDKLGCVWGLCGDSYGIWPAPTCRHVQGWTWLLNCIFMSNFLYKITQEILCCLCHVIGPNEEMCKRFNAYWYYSKWLSLHRLSSATSWLKRRNFKFPRELCRQSRYAFTARAGFKGKLRRCWRGSQDYVA